MKTKVFLDTNILLDLMISGRDSDSSIAIFRDVKDHLLEAQISTQSILDASYCARRAGVPFETFRLIIQDLLRDVNLGAIDSFDISWAFDNPSGDFEDDAQISSAINGTCYYFITHDKSQIGRKLPVPMKIVSPEDFVSGRE